MAGTYLREVRRLKRGEPLTTPTGRRAGHSPAGTYLPSSPRGYGGARPGGPAVEAWPTTGLNRVTIEAGTSLFIYFNNDAPPVGADHINRSSTGGSWAEPFDAGAYGMGLYFQTPFENGANIADHVQWSYGGLDNTTTGSSSSLTGQTGTEAFYRLKYPLP